MRYTLCHAAMINQAAPWLQPKWEAIRNQGISAHRDSFGFAD